MTLEGQILEMVKDLFGCNIFSTFHFGVKNLGFHLKIRLDLKMTLNIMAFHFKNRLDVQMTLKVIVKVIFGRKIFCSFHLRDQNYGFPFKKST